MDLEVQIAMLKQEILNKARKNGDHDQENGTSQCMSASSPSRPEPVIWNHERTVLYDITKAHDMAFIPLAIEDAIRDDESAEQAMADIAGTSKKIQSELLEFLLLPNQKSSTQNKTDLQSAFIKATSSQAELSILPLAVKNRLSGNAKKAKDSVLMPPPQVLPPRYFRRLRTLSKPDSVREMVQFQLHHLKRWAVSRRRLKPLFDQCPIFKK